MKLLWLDLETTGLRPEDRILSIGMRVTDPNLTTIAEKEWDVAQERLTNGMFEDEKVWKMHSNSGLLERCRVAPFNWDEVRVLARGFLHEHLRSEVTYIAGSSVHFDRGLLQRWAPELLKGLHYRLLDVSVFKVIAAIWAPGLMDKKTEPAHTPLKDIDGSIALLRYYAAAMLKDGVIP